MNSAKSKIFILLFNSTILTVGIVASSQALEFDITKLGEDMRKSIFFSVGIILGYGFILGCMSKVYQEEKYMMLLSAFEKDKLQKQYQNTLESLDIGIITKNDKTINYCNSKGIKFLDQEQFIKNNEDHESMLDNLRQKIKSFDTNWEVNNEQLKMQEDID